MHQIPKPMQSILLFWFKAGDFLHALKKVRINLQKIKQIVTINLNS